MTPIRMRMQLHARRGYRVRCGACPVQGFRAPGGSRFGVTLSVDSRPAHDFQAPGGPRR